MAELIYVHINLGESKFTCFKCNEDIICGDIYSEDKISEEFKENGLLIAETSELVLCVHCNKKYSVTLKISEMR